MTPERQRGYIPVDDLARQVTVEQVCTYYGTVLETIHRTGNEIRTRCFLVHCPQAGATGDRAVAIDTATNRFYCHHYGCGQSGGLLSLMDHLAPGTSQEGRPRGERFKQLARDLQAIADGHQLPPGQPTTVQTPRAVVAPEPATCNPPLADSPNERARALTDLDSKFTTDVASMPKAAAKYFRRRSWLTTEVCREWRLGYLPRDRGEDRTGGTQRGKIVYGLSNEEGAVLTWYGRDPEFEEKYAVWKATGQEGTEPAKVTFTKGFHRGLELYGQDRLRAPDVMERTRRRGLIVTEGPNDAIRVWLHGGAAVAINGCLMSKEQAAKLARLAMKYAHGVVTLMFDTDAEGEKGALAALPQLAALGPVRLGWSASMFDGEFKDRQPESLSVAEWQRLNDAFSGSAV